MNFINFEGFYNDIYILMEELYKYNILYNINFGQLINDFEKLVKIYLFFFLNWVVIKIFGLYYYVVLIN